MRNYAKISPIRRARSITSYQDGLFKTLIEIGYISCGTCQKAGDEISQHWIFSGEGRVHRKKRL